MRPENRLPAAGSAVVVNVFTVPESGKWRVLLLSEPDGIHQHWLKPKVSVPCLGDKCEPKNHRCRTMYKAYCSASMLMVAADHKSKQWLPVVFEITESAFFQLRQQPELTGTIWQFERGLGAFGTKEVFATFLERHPGELPYQFDFHPVVERLYRSRDIKWGQEPPFGERLVLNPVPNKE